MYTSMDLWNSVRNNYFQPDDGKPPSFNSLGRRYGVDHRVIKKILANPAPPGYQASKPRPLKKLAAHLEFIQQILAEDHATREKQRHIPQRIYERLVKERKYDSSSRAVRELVHRLRRQHKEVYIPLAQPMSQAQVDFFEADVFIHGQMTRVYVFAIPRNVRRWR